MVKYLFKDFLGKQGVYALNEYFWVRLLDSILDGKEIPYDRKMNSTFINGKRFLDGNPILEAFFPTLNRSIRIIQEEPESDQVEIGGWIETNDGKNELVISLELSSESKIIVEKYLKGWLIKNLSKDKMIDLINSGKDNFESKSGLNGSLKKSIPNLSRK